VVGRVHFVLRHEYVFDMEVKEVQCSWRNCDVTSRKHTSRHVFPFAIYYTVVTVCTVAWDQDRSDCITASIILI
jgi:hypothetical protein